MAASTAAATDSTMSSPTHFTLSTQSLKLDTQADIESHIQPLKPSSTSTSAATEDQPTQSTITPSSATNTTINDTNTPKIKPTSVSLSGNTLGVSASAHIADTLRTHHPQIQSVNFADIFTSRLLSEIPPALSSLLTACLDLPNLHTVDLSDNAFGLNTVEPLVKFLEAHVPLRRLILQNNGLGPRAGVQVAEALERLAGRKKEAYKNKQKQGEEGKDGEGEIMLETIICGRNRLESGSMSAWAKALTAHSSGLKTVKMVQNGIRQDGIKILLEQGLANCLNLETLDLQDNTFTIVGARALVSVVGKWTELRELGVGDCLLGARGGVLLGKELAKSGVGAELEILRAQYNEIDAKGVHELFVAADKGGLRKLRRVELNGNKFAEDDEGVEGLRVLLDKRKDESGIEDGDGEGEWGLDDLSDLEEEDSDEEAEAEDDDNDDDDDNDNDEDEKKEDEEEQAAKRETILKDADEAENAKVSQKKDDDVDALADQLGGTHVT